MELLLLFELLNPLNDKLVAEQKIIHTINLAQVALLLCTKTFI